MLNCQKWQGISQCTTTTIAQTGSIMQLPSPNNGKRQLISGCRFALEADMAREFARKFYSSKQWQDCRNAYMKRRRYLCESCLERGIYRPAEIVHHKIHITPLNIDNPEITLDFDNLEAVCRQCHDEIHDNKGPWEKVNAAKRKKKQDEQRYIVGPNGEISAK
jgi:hypothetical protein